MIIEELDNSIAFNITRVGTLLRRELIHALKDYDISPEQWQVILTLYTEGRPLSQRELTQATLKDKHVMSRLITKLENKQLITKIPSSSDSRVSEIAITDRGKKQKEEMHLILSTHVKERVFGFLEPDEKSQLLNLMKKMRNYLEK